MVLDEQQYKKQSDLFKALSESHRLMIIDMLSCGELCGCEILKKFNFTQPTLSYHMKILIDTGLVSSRRDGKNTYYQLDSFTTDEMLVFINHLFDKTKNNCICR